ncbi:MAG: FAD-binding oxidoreductase [Verrucomicrobiota bacterium]
MPSVSEVASVHEAAAVLAGASERGERVSIERDGGDVVLSTRRLDRMLEHEAGDLTAIVEAGIRLRDLAERLAASGQMLALDPPGNPTVGACIAANLSGPRRHRYGTARDLVIGMTVVLADGTIASSGGKVVKNVAGYDLAKLFCGSRGRLGLIARVALRLHPGPEATRTLVVPVSSAADSEEKAQAILRAPLAASAVDLAWPGRLAVLFEGGRRGVDEQFGLARDLVGGAEDDGSVWEEITARQASSRGRLLFPPGGLAETLDGLDEAVVRVSAGVAHVAEPVADSRDPVEIALAERVRAQFDPAGVLA